MESSTHSPNLDLGNYLQGPEAASPEQAPSSLPHGGSCRRSSHPSHQLTKREKRVRNKFITSVNATSKSTSNCGPVYILVSEHSYFLLPLQCKGSVGEWREWLGKLHVPKARMRWARSRITCHCSSPMA